MRFVKMMLVIGILLAGGVKAQDPTPDPVPTASSCGNDQYQQWRELEGQDQCIMNEEVSVSTSVSYPKELADKYPFVKTLLLDYIDRERYDFWEMTQNFGVHPDNVYHSLRFFLSIQSDRYYHSENIVSVIFTNSTYTGGPREWVEFDTFTIDLEAEKVITLQDLFVEGIDPYTTLAPLVRESVQARVPSADMNSIISGTIPSDENYTAWALSPTDIIFFYRRGQIVHAVLGPQMIPVALEDLKDYLRPEFLPKP